MDAQNQSPLASFKRDVHSQHGEDGIIDEVLNRLGGDRHSGWCVEFGAWDGLHLSNALNLIREYDYNAVLIEADSEKFEELKENHPSDKIVKVNSFVEISGDNSLDGILARTEIPADFDFLSIDIDSCDYQIWDSLQRYTPKMVCIEYNPTIPNAIDFVQPADFSKKWGTSAAALHRLGASKGYTLVAVTTTNLILVRDDLADAVLGTVRPTLDDLRPDGKEIVALFAGYDGTLLSNAEEVRLPWHRLRYPISSFQKIPRIFRRFPDDLSPVRKFLFKIFRAFSKLRRALKL